MTGRLYRALRRVIGWCVQHRMHVVGATARMLRRRPSSPSARCSSSSSRAPSGRSSSLQLRLPEGSAIGATLAVVKEAEALLEDDRDIATWTAYVGRGAPRFWLGLEPATAERGLCRDRHPVARCRGPRAHASRASRRRSTRAPCRQRGSGSTALDFGPPVGYPGAVPGDRARPQQVREIAWAGARHDAPQPQCRRAASRLERALAGDHPRGRPGTRPRPGADASGHGGRRFRPC